MAAIRRTIAVLLVVVGSFTAVTGIWNFFPPLSLSFSPGHAIGACIFGALCITHVWLNWKSILRYFNPHFPYQTGLIGIFLW